MIDIDLCNLNCVHSIRAFDKAMIIIESEPSTTKSFVLRLGVFHMHYCFLYFIGYLIMVSDHLDVFDLVDTENIVKDVVSDTAMANTIHA